MNLAEIVKGINLTAVVTVAAVVFGGVTLYYKLKSNQDKKSTTIEEEQNDNNIKQAVCVDGSSDSFDGSADSSIDDNGTVEEDFVDEDKVFTKDKPQ